jgi:hypothetical protein
MPSRQNKRWLARVACVLGAAALLTMGLVPASPASAHMPPLGLCTPDTEGLTLPQTFYDGTEDRILWRCTKSREVPGLPIVYYWKHRIVSDDEEAERKKAARSAIIRVVGEGIWQGVLQSGLASFGDSPSDRAHIRYVGSFDIRSWGGTPLNREINVHMVAKHSVNNGATWTTCGDTGWRSPGAPQADFSVEFYKLTSSCGGTITVFTRARFLKTSTNTWWTSNFLQTAPLKIPQV